MFLRCSPPIMTTRFDIPAPDKAAIAAAILSSPIVTRLALACQSERLRERAADTLADEIVERLVVGADQLTLAL